MGFGVTELLIVMAIVILLFGTKKLKNLGGDIGQGIKSFRGALADETKHGSNDDAESGQINKV